MFYEVIVTKLVVTFLRNTYEKVYQEKFFNKTDGFSERLQKLLINERIFDEIAVGTWFVLFDVIVLLYLQE